MLKKLALILIALCSMALAESGKLHSIVIDQSANDYFKLEGTYFQENDLIKQYAGKSVNLVLKPGYTVVSASATYGEGNSVKIMPSTQKENHYTFAMPDADVVVTGSFAKKKYAFTVEGCDGVKLICISAPDSAIFEETVTVVVKETVKDSLTIALNAGSNVYAVKEGENTKITFVMSSLDVKMTLSLTPVKEDSKPTRFALSIDSSFAKYCEFKGASGNVINDSANVNDEVHLFVDLPATVVSYGFGSKGLGEDVLEAVKEGEHYKFVMPANDVFLYAFGSLADPEVVVDSFNVKVDGNINASFSISSARAVAGASVKISIDPKEKYERIDFTVSGIDKSKVNVKDTVYSFTMPANDVEFKFSGVLPSATSSSSYSSDSNSGSSSSSVENSDQNSSGSITVIDTVPFYKVNIAASDNGTVKKSGDYVENHPEASYKGGSVVLTVYPDDGYALESISIKTADGEDVDVKKDGTKYKFTMPAGEVYVSATYKVANYKITIKNCGDMKCEAPTTAKYGDSVAVKVTMMNGVRGYDLSMDSVGNFAQKQSGSETIYTFTMPPYDVEFSFENIKKSGSDGEEGSSGSKGDTVYVDASGEMYDVTIENSEKGTITRYGKQIKDHPNEATEGLVVSLFVEPEPGYALDSLIVKDAKGKSVKWTKGEAYYEFTMPASDVSVSATYKTAVYKVDVNCGDMKCELSKSEAKYKDKITLKVTLNGQKSFPIRHNGVENLTQEQKGSIFTLTFTMPGHDVEISFVDEDDDIGSSDSKGDGKSSSSKDDGKSSGSKDDGKSSSSKGDKGDSKSDGKGDKDAIAAIAMAPAFSAQIQGRVVYVSGASVGSAYALLNMNGSVIAKGRVGAENFNVMAPNAGKFLLRVGREVRTLDVK